METKLTLRMDENIIHAAKRHARQQGTSLSKLIADYLQLISGKRATPATFKPTPVLAEITGVLSKTSDKKNLRNEYHKYLQEKYL